jgi:hypothetical protein
MHTNPQTRRGSFFDKIVLALAFALSAGLFLWFYPPFYGFRDEGIYLGLADALRHGKIFISLSEYPVSITVEALGRNAPFYPLGNSILLIPFLQFGWKTVFAAGLLMHLVGFALFRRLAGQFNASGPVPLLLYLFFPAFIFFSRTVMSDIPSLVCFLAAYIFYFDSKRKDFLAGFFFGLSLFFRVANAVMILPFILGQILNAVKTKKAAGLAAFFAGLLPFAILAAAYNTWIYGAPWLTGYSEVFTGVRSFNFSFLRANLPHYFFSLNLAYPFMLLVFLLDARMRRVEILALLLLHFLFFGFYYFHDSLPGKIPTLIFGNRFFFPVIPFLILSYGTALNGLLTKIPAARKAFLSLLLVICAASTFSIHAAHQRVLRDQAEAAKLIYTATPERSILICEGTIVELLQRFLGARQYVSYNTPGGFMNLIQDKAQSSDIYIALTASPGGGEEALLDPLREEFNLTAAGETRLVKLYRALPKQ